MTVFPSGVMAQAQMEASPWNSASRAPVVRSQALTTPASSPEAARAASGETATAVMGWSCPGRLMISVPSARFQSLRVRGGKEANVYCCAAHPSTGLDLIAAKVYRPAMFRSLRNDARYRQGREVVGEDGKSVHGRRESLAVQKNTRYGQELRHATWQETEFQILQRLHEAGADVPRPLAISENVILMEYVGAESAPAPTLNQVRLELPEARALLDRLVHNLAVMLACNCVHADLSAYNILYWNGQFKIIDFPQAVDPRRNPDARALFFRDVERVCQYFARYQITQDARALADKLWSQLQSGQVPSQALASADYAGPGIEPFP